MNEQEEERRKKLEKLKNLNQYPFSIEKVCCDSSISDLIHKSKDVSDDELKNICGSLIGRIVSIRQSFFTLKWENKKIQLYFSSKNCEDKLTIEHVNLLDLGDVVLVEGSLFKTKLGELTLRIKKFKIISKCLNCFPSEYYGIKDEKQKFRDRVGKLLVDRQFYNTLLCRSKIISFIRNYLLDMGYIEFETPILESTYGGANAVPFETKFEALNERFFLRIAPELALKKAIISGFPKVFEIGKVFRNEGMDSSHNPEFTTLEIYTVNHGLEDVMNLTEDIIKKLANHLEISEILWPTGKIDFQKPFKRINISEEVEKETGLDFYLNKVDFEVAKKKADEKGVILNPWENKIGHILHKIFDKLIAPKLIQPTFVTGFHKDVSPLAKTDPENREFTLRYELFIGGMEYSNGFAELNDPDEQKARFNEQEKERVGGNREAFEMDESFIFALKYGLPPTGGIGMGIDRLVMLFTNQTSIKDVLFLPPVKK